MIDRFIYVRAVHRDRRDALTADMGRLGEVALREPATATATGAHGE